MGGEEEVAGRYSFGGTALIDSYRSKNCEQLDHYLNGFIHRTTPSDRERFSYDRIRDHVCAINIVMNERGVKPPRFRESRKVPYKPKPKYTTPKVPGVPRPSLLSLEEQMLSHDRKMIDLHWLHETGKRDKVNDVIFRDMFDREHFDFDLASKFIEKDWTTEKRAVEILQLSNIEQWQLATLASKSVQSEWKKVNERALGIEKILRDNAFKRPQIKGDISDFKLLWTANEMAGKLSQKFVATVLGWLKGKEPLSASTISAKLKRVRKWTIAT